MQSANAIYWDAYHAFIKHLEQEEIFLKGLNIDQLDLLDQANNDLFENYVYAYKNSDIGSDIISANQNITNKIKSIKEILEIDRMIFSDMIKDLTKQFEQPKVAYGPYVKITAQAKPSLQTKQV